MRSATSSAGAMRPDRRVETRAQDRELKPGTETAPRSRASARGPAPAGRPAGPGQDSAPMHTRRAHALPPLDAPGALSFRGSAGQSVAAALGMLAAQKLR